MLFIQDLPDDPTDPREQAFHEMIRENVIFLLILISLYGFSYLLISSFRKCREEFLADEEDAFVYRVSFWMCTFSLATSLGSAFLLPFSIVTNEVLLLYTDNYYIQWLNDSLIQGLWNYVFLFSNISLFILLPFAYFFPESEGLSGSRRGIMPRVNETLVLLLLLFVLVLGLTYILSGLIGYSDMALVNLLTLWHYLPFLYSCVSFLGVLLLLLSTPVGIARLFTVLGELIVKPQFLRNIQEEYEIVTLEEMNLKRKLNNLKGNCISPFSNFSRSKSVPSIPLLSNGIENIKYNNLQNFQLTMSPSSQNRSTMQRNVSSHILELEDELQHTQLKRRDLESQRKISVFRRNLSYPLAMVVLLSLTIFAVLLVFHNSLELIIGFRELPISSAATSSRFSLGIKTLSKMGHFGAALEIILILYLWSASIVGLYTLPFINRLKPKPKQTSFTQCVINCAFLLILSTALPVLARTVGITNFDLLGNFGRIKWLGNFYVVLLYNVIFAATTVLSLTGKFTVTVRKELLRRLEASLGWSRTWRLNKSIKTLNGLVTKKHD